MTPLTRGHGPVLDPAVPRPSPFHERTSALCESWRYKDWAGWIAPSRYGHTLDAEYNAVRRGAGVLDVTPLYKYDIVGPDAGRFLARVMVRNVAKMKSGRMTYLCWCDDHGKVLDDGTCARLEKEWYRVTAAAPSWWWLSRHARTFDCEVRDVTDEIAALAVQGPTARDILREICDADMDALKFFGVTSCDLAGAPGWLSRTGYTGDLGYELWVPTDHAHALWDALMEAGKPHGIAPIGLDALDVTRVEAGFILQGADYFPANEALIEAHKSSPFELGLGWTVKLKERDPPFIGQAALRAEKERGSAWALVGLDIEWEALEAMFHQVGLPPSLSPDAWRSNVPVHKGSRQVGRATSGTWSPILKKNLALATVEAGEATVGTQLTIDWLVDWQVRRVPCVVVQTPFFDPPRKRE
jgi:aminomethyltransferase